MAAPMMQDPSADPAAETESDSGANAYTIEITVTADGKITVGVESSDQENAEESGSPAAPSPDADASADPAEAAEPADGSAQPAKDIKSALVMALEIYKNNGEAPEPDDSDAQFAAGAASYGGGQ